MGFDVLCSLSDVLKSALEDKTKVFGKSNYFKDLEEDEKRVYDDYIIHFQRFNSSSYGLLIAMVDFYNIIKKAETNHEI